MIKYARNILWVYKCFEMLKKIPHFYFFYDRTEKKDFKIKLVIRFNGLGNLER